MTYNHNTVIPTERSDEGSPCRVLRSLTFVRDDSEFVRDDSEFVRDNSEVVRDNSTTIKPAYTTP